MTEIMLALGDFRFSVGTAAYQQLRRTVEYRWPSQARVGRRPSRQFVGIGEETIGLDGVIYPHYKGGLGQLPDMRTAAGKGEPQTLADGLGNIWGKFCILRVEETQTVFASAGVPRKIEFRLELANYGEDSHG